MLRFLAAWGVLVSSANAMCKNECAVVSDTPGATRLPVILDHDGNIDDMVALPYLVKNGVLDLRAVIYTATGFSTPVIGFRNTLKILELLCLGDIDIGRGPIETAFQHGKFPAGCDYAKYIPRSSIMPTDNLYGVIDDYLPYSERADHPVMSAADVYKKHVDAGVTTIIAIGTLTAIWDFKTQYPDSFAKVKNLYLMFGTIAARGNVFTKAGHPVEFNAAGDPVAAKEVLHSDTLQNIVLVPLDATNDVPMTPEYMDSLAKLDTPEGKFVSKLTHGVQDGWFSGKNGFYGWADDQGTVTEQSEADAYFFWDPLAVALVIDPTLAEYKTANISIVVTDPPGMDDGQTKLDPAGGVPMKYADVVSKENAEKVRMHIEEALDRKCLTGQPLPIATVMKMVKQMSTCGTMKNFYKEHECCGAPDKVLMP